jgi:hypothetical protein
MVNAMGTAYAHVRLPAKYLQLADVVQLEGIDGFNTALVKQVTAEEVTLFRPYGQHADFQYTGGVICYIGVDEFKIARNDVNYLVLRRTDLR